MSDWQGMAAGQGGPRISLAMMVKNEEANLPSCLESAAPWVDEIIVVDTGSTDRTIEIAKSYGAKVYHHPWQRHFSLHRNQSIGYCSGDWVLILDADERLKPGSGEMLRRAAAHTKADAVCAVVRSLFQSGRAQGIHVSPRLFRNNGRIHYEGRVHNVLIGQEKEEAWPIDIIHTGYDLDEAGTQAKFERTATLLKEDIAENPSNPRPHHYLAASYLTRKMYPEAIAEAREAIGLLSGGEADADLYLWSYFIGAIACLESGRHEEAEEFCRQALEKRPNHFDSHYVLCRLSLERQDWERVLAESERFLELAARFNENPAAFGLMVFNTAGHSWQVWHYRAVALLELGRPGEAEEAFAKALQAAPDPSYCLRLRGRYHGYNRRYEEARRWFARALELKPDDPEVYRDLAASWRGEGVAEEERRALERLVELTGEPGAALRLAGLELEAGELEAARRHFEQGLEAVPGDVPVLLKIAACCRQLGDLEGALAALERVCELEPDSAPSQAGLAEALLEAGDPRAREALERALELAPGPETSGLRVRSCRLALEEGDIDTLTRHCEALLQGLGLDCHRRLETTGDLAGLFMQVGERLLEYEEDSAAALAFGLAVELDGELRRRVAGLYSARGLFQEALGQLEAALGDTPRRDTLLEMGSIYDQIGLAEAARLCRREAARFPEDGKEPALR